MLARNFRWFVLLAAACLPSCIEGADIALYTCPNPVVGHLDAHGYSDPCCKDTTNPCPDGGTPGPSRCDGDCMPLVDAAHWIPTPVLLWYGSGLGPIPTCPDDAHAPATLGADPITPNTCPLCTCGEPSCVLPQGVIAERLPGRGDGLLEPERRVHRRRRIQQNLRVAGPASMPDRPTEYGALRADRDVGHQRAWFVYTRSERTHRYGSAGSLHSSRVLLSRGRRPRSRSLTAVLNFPAFFKVSGTAERATPRSSEHEALAHR